MSEALIVAGSLFASLALICSRALSLRAHAVNRVGRIGSRGRIAAMLAIVSFVWPAYIYFSLPVGPAVNPFTVLAVSSLVFTVPLLTKQLAALSSFKTPASLRNAPAILALLMLVWKIIVAAIFYSEVKNVGFVDVLTVALPLVLIVASTTFEVQASTFYRLLYAVFWVVMTFAAFELVTQTVAVQPLALAAVSDQRLDTAVQVNLLASEKDRGSGLRLQSVLPHPILLAQLGAMLAVLLLSKVAQKGALNSRWTGLFSIGFCLLIIFFTDSRTGIIIAPAALAMLLLLLTASKFKSPKTVLLLFFLILIAGAGLTFGESLEALLFGRTEAESSSTASRLLMLSIGIQRISEAFWFGYGPGSAGVVVGIQGAENVYSLDNLFLYLALNWGTPLAVAHYALVVILLARSTRYAISRHVAHDARVLCAAASATTFIYLATSLIVAIDSLFLFTVWIALIAISKARPKPLTTTRLVRRAS